MVYFGKGLAPMRSTLRRFLLTTATFFLFAGSLTAWSAEKDSSYQAAMASIQAGQLVEHVGQFADVAMEGREAGTRGGRAAGDYLAEQYARLGLRGAGSDGGYFQPFAPNFRNFLAFLPGSDPQLRDQIVLIGAHYDHIGYGRHASRGPYGYVHPGADDNGSGTAALLELAQAFTMLAAPPKRSILFAHWDAEEKGLLGSKYWVSHPTFPLQRVAAAINLDMIGRLRDDTLLVFGVGSGAGWRRLVSLQNEENLKLAFGYDVANKADHYPLYQGGIPVVMFHTGTHDEYHRPSDVVKFINSPGLERVTRLVFRVAYDLAERPTSLRLRNANAPVMPVSDSGKPADRLGVGWQENAAAAGGIRVSKVVAGSSADRIGVKVGDRILRFAGCELRSDSDFYAAVSAAQNPASMTIERSGEQKPLELQVELSGNPLRWGFLWRIDDAEPDAVILTHVVPGSPAAKAGLKANDRIYRVGDRDFGDESEFSRRVKTQPEPIYLLVERDGRLQTVVLQVPRDIPLDRAA